MTALDPAHNELLIAVHDTCDIHAVRRLIAGGIDVNLTTPTGCTPLMFAVMPSEFGDHNSVSAIRAMALELLQLGADPSRSDSSGLTAMDHARQLIDPDWKDKFGASAFSQYGPSVVGPVEEIISILESSRDSGWAEQDADDQLPARAESEVL